MTSDAYVWCAAGALVVLSAACTTKSATGPTAATLALTCPNVPAISSSDGRPVTVTYDMPNASGGKTPVNTTCTPTSGSSFNVGSTTVTCQSSDASKQSASCSFGITVKAPPSLQFTRYLAFGDSITQGGTADPIAGFSRAPLVWDPERISADAFAAEPYPLGVERRLSAKYPQQSFQVINAGVSGEIAYIGGIARFQSVVRAQQPDAVLLMEGTNDIESLSGIDAGIAALDQMIKQAEGLKVPVLLATIPPQRPDGVRRRAIYTGRVFVFNDKVRGLADSHHLLLVDIFTPLLSTINQSIGVDDVHPTQQGYSLISDTWVSAITGNLEKTTSSILAAQVIVKLVVVAALVAGIGAVGDAAVATRTPAGIGAAVTAYEQARAAAVRDRDDRAYRRLASPDLTVVRADGTLIGREEQLGDVAVGLARPRPGQTDEPLNIRVFGDLAVVSGRSTWRYSDDSLGQEYFLRVWVRAGAGWRLITSQVTTIPRRVVKTSKLVGPRTVLDPSQPVVVREVDPGRGSKDEILRALHEQHRLYWQQNVPAYSQYVADDVLRIAEFGIRTKRELVDGIGDNLRRPTTPQVDEHVHIAGNAAVVTWRDAGVADDGTPTQGWYTMVFAKRRGQWQIVQIHTTPIPPNRAIPVPY